jgi:hypothetical protein
MDLGDERVGRFKKERAGLAVFVISFLGACMGANPLGMNYPSAAGLDPSWVMVLGEAARLHLGFGEGILFTGGPLSSVYTHYPDSVSFVPKVAARLLVVVVLALLITNVARNTRRYRVAFAIGVLLQAPGDHLLLALPFLAALSALTAKELRLQPASSLLAVIATAVGTLAKFSVAPVALVTFVAVDFARAAQGRRPVHSVGYAVATFLLFAFFDHAATFTAYLTTSLEVTMGYSDAMSVAGSSSELIAYLVVSLCFLLGIVLTERRAVQSSRLPWKAAASRTAVFVVYLFLVWKEGFVRHDLRSLNAWGGLAIALVAYAAVSPEPSSSAWRDRVVLPSCVTTGLLLELVVAPFLLHRAIQMPFGAIYSEPFLRGKNVVAELGTVLSSPSRWRRLVEQRKAEAEETIRRERPLPRLDGSVDTIGSIQARVLANRLDYRPRPSFQEYATYTRGLSEANRRSLVEHGPDYLLFESEPLDGRHPALAEGPLWPDILRLYQPESLVNGVLVLRRRSEPLGDLLGKATFATVRLGQEAVLPTTSDPLFLEIDLEKNLLGRLASLLFRAPIVTIVVTYADGRTEKHRLIPGIAASGFLVSPTVSDSRGFFLLASGRSEAPAPSPVRAITIEADGGGAAFYQTDIGLSWRALDAKRLFERTTLPPAMTASLEASSNMIALSRSVPPSTLARMIPQGCGSSGACLFAHAPTELSLVVTKTASSLDVAFGILADAWPQTHGVCFAVSVDRRGARERLVGRCLHPSSDPGDRSEAAVHVEHAFDAGDTLRLETTCEADCDYDWSYWSSVALREER